MALVSIITGGAGGMGLATAKVVGGDHHVIISDVNQKRLSAAASELKQLGISCDAVVCDITDIASVDALFKFAATQGHVRSVIHTAGVSPQMAIPDSILKINAVGTINITQAAYEIADEDFALVNVASMAAYMLPRFIIPLRAYSLAFRDVDRFIKKLLFPCRFMPNKLYRNGMAYSLSKSFVIWYSRKNAAKFGQKNARILSVSPGSFDTDMGRLEVKSGSEKMLEKAAIKRFGRADEIAELLAFCASPKAGYLTGADILCDGGVVAARM